MTNLPGFSKVRGLTKFSELEIDKSFTENMKQLNQKSSNRSEYQWDLKEISFQSEENITIDTNMGTAPVHAIGKPYWKLQYDTTTGTVSQEFDANIQESTVGGYPATMEFYDNNYLILEEQDTSGALHYNYTRNHKVNNVVVGGTEPVKNQMTISAEELKKNNSSTEIGIGNQIYGKYSDNDYDGFALDCSGAAILNGKSIITEDSSSGFNALVGTQSFDNVMKILNKNGTENTYLLDGNAKIKIGANLKVSTEADTTEGGESNEPTS